MQKKKELKSALEHFAELRARVIIILVSIVATSIAGYVFSSRILDFFLAPAKEIVDTLIFLRPAETNHRLRCLTG